MTGNEFLNFAVSTMATTFNCKKSDIADGDLLDFIHAMGEIDTELVTHAITIKPIPFMSVGNDELEDEPIPETITCPHCGEEHPVDYGKDAKTGEKTNLLAFYICPQEKKSYICGIDGKRLK